MSNPASQSTTPQIDSPAHHLLLICARPRLDDSDRASLNSLLQQPPDWASLISMAQRHALLPLMHHHLSKSHPDVVPPAYAQQLKVAFQDNAARNVVLMAELLSITHSLKSRGIESFPFKGPLLGSIAYGDASLRQSIDLDIVVRERDVGAAWKCLTDEDYRPTKKLDARQARFLVKRQHNIQFARDGTRLLVELHWRIAPKLFARGFSADDLWDRLETIKFKDVALKSLPVEELLMTLCIHGARHLWERLSWVSDLAAIITSAREIRWSQLLAMANETHTERMLLVGLQLATELLNAPLPPEVMKAIGDDSGIPALSKGLTTRMVDASHQHSFRETFRYNIQMRTGLASRLRYCRFAMSPTDGELELLSVPRGLSFLYYGLRPWRLLARSSRHAN